jgi:hypothetical protein
MTTVLNLDVAIEAAGNAQRLALGVNDVTDEIRVPPETSHPTTTSVEDTRACPLPRLGSPECK